MDRSGNGFLACPGLAEDQERQAVARGLGGNRKRRPEFGSRADQLFEFERRSQLLGHRRKLARGTPTIGVGGKRFEQALGRDRANEKIGCAGAHRFDRNRDRVAMRDDDHRQVGPMLAKNARSGSVPVRRPSFQGLRRDLTPMRALKERDGEFAIAGVDDAPRRACGNGCDQSALVGVRVQEQEGACRFFAHFLSFAKHTLRGLVKGDLRRS